MVTEMMVPTSNNLSIAWARAFLAAAAPGISRELSPLVVTVTDMVDGEAQEILTIRQALDAQLKTLSKQSCHTVANTVFPQSMWNPNEEDGAEKLFQRYDNLWPAIKRFQANRQGTYFRRMTAYCPKGLSTPVNQLEHIISTFRRGNHRRSALQVAIFDPTRDHKHSLIGRFPCLQQVAFVPIGGDGLCVTGFYPMHYIFQRAYGNYLGLWRLGHFMAKNMGLRFVKLVCVSSVAKRDDGVTKTSVKALREELTTILAKSDESQR